MSPARSTRCWLTTVREFTDLRTTSHRSSLTLPGVAAGECPRLPAVSLSVGLNLGSRLSSDPPLLTRWGSSRLSIAASQCR